ncbi:MAG: heliorhodopsin HeR [Euryarchaeota archaeon]|nr:heliorhodopsin HeR [Euryarchaeota archaeon]
MVKVQTDEEKFLSLRRFNAAMFILHLIQAIAILVITYLIIQQDVSLPVRSYFLSNYDPVTQVVTESAQTLFEMPLAILVAGFLFFSAFDHLIIAGPLYKRYRAGLKEGHNYFRWYEYAFSSSLMIVVICMLVGIREISSLIAIFSITACMNLFGLLMEKINQRTEKVDWTAYIYGCFAGLIPWAAIAIYLFGAGAEGNVPDFVYWIFLTIAIFYFSFAFNMFLQYKRVGRWKDYLFGERVYIILSLVAKTALAWQVWAGTLAPLG